jgi:hypothetical protein
VVGALDGCRKILEASLVAPPDILPRHIMATRENSISDSSQVDFNIFCPDVDQHDLETTNARVSHHLQIMFPSQRRLDGEALMLADMLFCRSQNLTRGSNRKCYRRRRLQCFCDCIRIGIARKTSEFQPVRVVLPEPLGPAMMVSLGRFNGRMMRKTGIAVCAVVQQGFPAIAFSQ